MSMLLFVAAFPTFVLPVVAWIPPHLFEEEVAFLSNATLATTGKNAVLHREMRLWRILLYFPVFERPPPQEVILGLHRLLFLTSRKRLLSRNYHGHYHCLGCNSRPLLPAGTTAMACADSTGSDGREVHSRVLRQ